MALVEIHNITDRPNTDGEPRSYIIGGQKLRPGKSITVDSSVLNRTFFERLHGTRLWVGSLPARFARTSRSALRARDRQLASASELEAPMELAEARKYLDGMKLSELVELQKHMSPPVFFKKTPSKPALVSRLSRAMFQSYRELDPEVFFWLRRWVKNRHGDYNLRG